MKIINREDIGTDIKLITEVDAKNHSAIESEMYCSTPKEALLALAYFYAYDEKYQLAFMKSLFKEAGSITDKEISDFIDAETNSTWHAEVEPND